MKTRIPISLLTITAAVLLTVAGAVPAQQDGLWFASYDSGTSTAGVTKYAFDGTVIKDVVLPGSRLCYSAAVDYAQNIWVTDNTGKLFKIDNTGAIQLTATVSASPQGVAVDATGNVIIVSRGAKTATKYSPTGVSIATGSTVKGALSVVVDNQGNIWVPIFDLGSGVPFELYKFDANLANPVLYTFTPNSTSSFGFSGIATDMSGDVYVANQARSSVMRISAAGAMVWEAILAPGYARGVAADAIGNVWAAGHAGRNLFKIRASDGAVLMSIATPNSYPLCGALVDANSDVWSLGNMTSTPLNVINKWNRADGTNLFGSIQRKGSTVATGDSSGFHSAVFLNPTQDFDGDSFDNLSEAMAGSNYMDIHTTPQKPTPIISGPFSSGKKMYIGFRHKASAGRSYAAAFSFGKTPGILIPGVGTVPLNSGPLFYLSLLFGSPIFNNMQGALDSNGDGLANVVLPAGIPPNITVYTAFVTYDTAIRTISNPVTLVTQ